LNSTFSLVKALLYSTPIKLSKGGKREREREREREKEISIE